MISTEREPATKQATPANRLSMCGYRRQFRKAALAAFCVALIALAGCHKSPPPSTATPPPPEPAPSASISANPAAIRAGESSQLTWQTKHATAITIEGLGQVDSSGSRSVSPTESTTYRLTATGPGGDQEATTRVTVTGAAANTTPTPAETGAGEGDVNEASFSRNVRDVYFDYDSYTIRADAQQQLKTNAAYLAKHPGLRVQVEGHCDERGSTEFNLALGDSRANAVKQFLVQAGVGADRIATMSYGKERPFCSESNEECWQQNRRGHFVMQR